MLPLPLLAGQAAPALATQTQLAPAGRLSATWVPVAGAALVLVLETVMV